VYDREDPVARSLAERMVAIVRNTGPAAGGSDARGLARIAPELFSGATVQPIVAAPVAEGSLRSGSELAYVLHVPSRTTARCMALGRLEGEGGRWLTPETLVPLIETRSTLLARPGAPPMSIDWDGMLHIHPIQRVNERRP
jgi:hypothetical protein